MLDDAEVGGEEDAEGGEARGTLLGAGIGGGVGWGSPVEQASVCCCGIVRHVYVSEDAGDSC